MKRKREKGEVQNGYRERKMGYRTWYAGQGYIGIWERITYQVMTDR